MEDEHERLRVRECERLTTLAIEWEQPGASAFQQQEVGMVIMVGKDGSQIGRALALGWVWRRHMCMNSMHTLFIT